jgi:betaine-aldehyde dehydrogenase
MGAPEALSFLDPARWQGRVYSPAWASAQGGTADVVEPATGATLASVGLASPADMAAACQGAAVAQPAWAALPPRERAAVLRRAGDLFTQHFDELAMFIARETGGILPKAQHELREAATLCHLAAGLVLQPQGLALPTAPGRLNLARRVPHGVVGVISPFNFPLILSLRAVAPALAAGNAVVLKPDPQTPVSGGFIIARVFQEAGLPPGVLHVLPGGPAAGEALVTDPQVRMIQFTGSTAVGRRIGELCGKHLKKVSLELGGKNPQVIFPDADLDAAADAITFGIYFNAGECCNSGSRIIVHEDVAEALTDRIAALSRKVPFGDPLSDATQVGAIISDEHLGKIDGYVREAQAAGAKVVIGGGVLAVPGLDGRFYAPTVVAGVTPEMAIAREEVFGPVLSVLTFRTEDEAIELANNAAYGLSAGVWSLDVHTCLNFARKVRAGTVWTNTWMDGFAELPFGGVKESGLGRELGRFGIEEYLELKTVQMRVARGRNNWVAG